MPKSMKKMSKSKNSPGKVECKVRKLKAPKKNPEDKTSSDGPAAVTDNINKPKSKKKTMKSKNYPSDAECGVHKLKVPGSKREDKTSSDGHAAVPDNINIPESETIASKSKDDHGEAECEVHKPKAPEETQEDKTSLDDHAAVPDNINIPKSKKITFKSKDDLGEAECEAHKPKAPEETQEDKTSLDDHAAASQSSEVPNTDIETLNEVSNLSTAHEIVVKQDFSVEEDLTQNSSIDSKFVEKMCEAFWVHLKEQLSNTPPDFSCVLELLSNIKHILITLLLPRQNGLRNEIEEALNMDILKEEIEHGVLNVPVLSTGILHVMALLCVPFRDEAVQNLERIKDPVELLRGIFHVLSLMKMDMVNYTVRNSQPYLQDHAVQDERAKFQELLDKQPHLLDCTTKWITRAATDLITRIRSSKSTSSSFRMAISLPVPVPEMNPDPPSLTMVLYQGYLNLVLRDHGNEEFPETLMMDRARLQIMKSKLHDLTILASVLLVARSFCCGVLFSSPEFVDKLKCITKALTEDFITEPEEAMLRVSEQVSEEIHQGLKDKGLTALNSENRASLVGQLQNIAKKENNIRTIIEQRIHLFLKCCLVRGMQESLIDSPGGLLFIEGELAELGWKFVNLMHHNQQVFSPYYADILKNVLSSPNQEDAEPVD